MKSLHAYNWNQYDNNEFKEYIEKGSIFMSAINYQTNFDKFIIGAFLESLVIYLVPVDKILIPWLPYSKTIIFVFNWLKSLSMKSNIVEFFEGGLLNSKSNSLNIKYHQKPFNRKFI